tara:strand:+ start:500 stop:814 length:315 start_codon:yes stop_codon:yes gene_type:complete
MSTILFQLSSTSSHTFAKQSFRYMDTSYSSGTTGSVFVYFAAEGDIVDMDKITLTVPKDFIMPTAKHISRMLSRSGNDEIQKSTLSSAGINRYINSIIYTDGIA